MPTDSEPNFLYTVVTAIISAIGGVITGSYWVNKAQAKKLGTDTDIALRNLEKEEKKEFVEDRIKTKKAMDFLEGQIREMKIDFAQKLDVALSEIARLREENDLITRKYNLQVILNSSTKN